MMQRQDRANAFDKRPQRDVRAGKIQRLQTAANDRLSQTGHGRSLLDEDTIPRVR
jgi:hypothetical protein